jgi:hypothetical protein
MKGSLLSIVMFADRVQDAVDIVRERTVSQGRFFSMATLSIPLFDGSHSQNGTQS